MFLLMDKKIIAILRYRFLLNWTYAQGRVSNVMSYKGLKVLIHRGVTIYGQNRGLFRSVGGHQRTTLNVIYQKYNLTRSLEISQDTGTIVGVD